MNPPKKQNCLMAITGAFQTSGGIAAVNRLIINVLSDAGYSLEIAALNEKINYETDYSVFKHISYKAFRGNKLLFTLFIWMKILTNRYTFVYCDHVNLASILAIAGHLKLARYLVWVHGIEVFPPLPDLQGKMGLSSFWKCLASSDFTKQKLLQQLPNMQIDVCDLALPNSQVKFSSSEIVLNSVNGMTQQLGKYLILNVGRMATGEQYKGQDTLIHAMPTILQTCPEAQLVLVGKGDDMPRLQRLAVSYSAEIQKMIFIPGFVPDNLLEQLYQKAYLFAMPSRGEGFGLVYLEAMRWGKPCLGSRTDAAQCIIRDGETGILVDDPTDYIEVANKIIELLKKPDVAIRMGQKGYELINSYYLYPHFVRRFWEILQV